MNIFNKFLMALVMIVSVAYMSGAPLASAYGYFPVVCISLQQNISYGSRDAYTNGDVSRLQQFLITQGYLAITTPTGYYGMLTVSAVQRFQQSYGLPATGAVDALTRSAIHTRDCGGVNYNNGYGYGYGVVTLNSLSTNSGPIGTYVTIYGNNFDPTNNTINFGNGAVTAITSSSATSLTFVVPQSVGAACNPYTACPLYAQLITPGTYTISVTNSHGTSNTLSFTVTSGNYGGGYYGGYGNPTLSYITPSSGSVGTYVTIYGTGFSYTGNTVHVGNAILQNISSPNGTSLSFTIPSQNYSCQYQYYLNSGCVNYYTNYNTYNNYNSQNYNIFVTNAQGYTSNTIYFYVTGNSNNGYPGNGNLSINNISGPTTLGRGVPGTWNITLYSPYSSFVTTSVHWGDEPAYISNIDTPQTTYTPNQQNLTFTHTYQSSGTYTVTFTARDNNGNQTLTSETVTVY